MALEVISEDFGGRPLPYIRPAPTVAWTDATLLSRPHNFR